MGTIFGSAVLATAGLFGLYTAWISGRRPEGFARRLGLAVANAGGINEIRAQYAGFFLAVALICGAALAGWAPRQAAFVVLAVMFGGLIGGRLVSLIINRGASGYTPAIRALYAIDSVGLALAVASLMVDNPGHA